MSNARNLANLLGTDTKIKTADIADEVFQSNRNLIINGAMQVWQRGTTTDTITTGGYLCDRWRIAHNGTDGNVDVDQSTDVPSGQGFGYSQKISMDASETSLDAGDQVNIQQRFEGQNLQLLEKGSSSAKKVTLSFWVKSSVAATYSVNLVDRDNTRIIGATYVVNSANTWEKKTITFDGDTSGTLDNDANRSLDLRFWLDTGTTYTSGTFATSWGASSDAVSASATTGWLESTSPEFYITGVQLEVGEQATPFEHRSYVDEFARCQRYYFYESGDIYGGAYGSGGFAGSSSLPTTMRASPTLSYTNVRTTSGLGAYTNPNSAQYIMTSNSPYVTGLVADAEL